MPSPFPGMDPFLEGQVWEEFHQLLIGQVHGLLVPQVRPGYVVRVEQRIYLEHPSEETRQIIPDVSLTRQPPSGFGSGAAVVDAAPFSIPLSMPEERRESFLEIRIRESGELVTVIELLSPSNKRPGSEGAREYLAKRELLLRSGVHLVELDLLRGGRRMPTARPLPPGDYYAVVSRVERRPMADVWPFTLRDPLPALPVPLAVGDGDARLDLAAAFKAVYDRAGYDYSLDCTRGATPPLSSADAAWAEGLLGAVDRRA